MDRTLKLASLSFKIKLVCFFSVKVDLFRFMLPLLLKSFLTENRANPLPSHS